MDDKVKHRIVGVVVIAVFLVILVPALFKNFIWRSEAPQTSTVQSPFSTSENKTQPENFQTSQIAQVSLNSPAMPAENMPVANIQANAAEVSSGLTTLEQPTMPNEQTASVPVSEAASTVAEPAAVQSVSTVTPAAAPTAVAVPKPAVVAPAPVTPKSVVKPMPAVKTVIIKKPVTVIPVKKVYVPVRAVPRTPAAVAQNPINYCIQMGAFSNVANAQLLVNRLKARGFYSARTEAMTFPNGTKGQRVVVCRVMTKTEAMMARARLAQLTGSRVILVKQG